MVNESTPSVDPQVQLESVVVDGLEFLRLEGYDRMAPFMMSLASDTDAWTFVMSSGGMTVGRTDPDGAIFPYVTVDRLTHAHRHTGPVTMLRIDGQIFDPFADDPDPRVRRSLDKSVLGHQLAWNAEHLDLGVRVRTRWATCDDFGHVRTVSLRNTSTSPITVELLDGFRNLMPSGVPLALMQQSSCLVDAYKRVDVDGETGLATIALTARIVDKPEAAEALRTSTVWCQGLDDATIALDPEVPARFRRGLPIESESLLTGRPAAVFRAATITLEPGEERQWHQVADIGRDHVQIEELRTMLRADDDVDDRIEAALAASTRELEYLLARADGFQCSRDRRDDHHHLANVLFNVMRGGTFFRDYDVPEDDYERFLEQRTGSSAAPDPADDYRLQLEYLPLHFGRRHGDPSRPWNRFAIKVRDHLGNRVLEYQGNWRDIFQNWEALAIAYPDFLPNMIARFVNASTIDGFNPYRVIREGVDWEVEDPDDPWSFIGYWGDHQIIYLLKLIEWAQRTVPARFDEMLAKPIFTYTDVPYRLRDYEQIVADPHSTLDFEEDVAERIEERTKSHGTDAQLVADGENGIIRVSLYEKLLVPVLSKLSNLVADAGIWMNTQRPEWNDANNALVGYGVSMVTLGYLRRYLVHLWPLFRDVDSISMSLEVRVWLDEIRGVLERFRPALAKDVIDEATRRALLDALGEAFERYRHRVDDAGLSRKTQVSGQSVADLFAVAVEFADHALKANVRDDGLVHAYNVLTLTDDAARIDHLDVMLEGQVAAISSGGLDDDAVLAIVDALFEGPLYREDQNSFLLYPAKELPSFFERNHVDERSARGIPLIKSLLEAEDNSIVAADATGTLRFHGDFTNADDVEAALDRLAADPQWKDRVRNDRSSVLELFEETFDHRSFTGRSGTMYGYEGLGCIYWHMVAKLLVAVQEVTLRRAGRGERDATFDSLASAYYRVRGGLGFEKSPDEFGAFPTDPYSHTPGYAGAQQPGMTGQVKEEILTRMGELGVNFEAGRVGFQPAILRASEFLDRVDALTVVTREAQRDRIEIKPGSLGFTLMGVPVVYSKGGAAAIVVHGTDGSHKAIDGDRLDASTSRRLIGRDGSIARLDVTVREADLLT